MARQKQADGSFSVQDGGEVDIRAANCGLMCAPVLNVLDDSLCQDTLEWLSQCKTYQGDFAYCGVAAYLIIQHDKNMMDGIPMHISGGFQRRTRVLAY